MDTLPVAIRSAFREQRRRLDLYCGLEFVFLAAIVPSIAVSLTFSRSRLLEGVAVPFTIAFLAFVSYRATVASGRKFGIALSAISEHRVRQSRQLPFV